MRILAYYADKDKENVYQTPGFNKTKNPNFCWLPYVCLCVCLYNIWLELCVMRKQRLQL